jgi:hypothetical protein
MKDIATWEYREFFGGPRSSEGRHLMADVDLGYDNDDEILASTHDLRDTTDSVEEEEAGEGYMTADVKYKDNRPS